MNPPEKTLTSWALLRGLVCLVLISIGVGTILGLGGIVLAIFGVLRNVDLEIDPTTEIFTGEVARDKLLWIAHCRGSNLDPASFPVPARDFYLHDGGNFNGSIVSWAFTCETVEDCYRVAEGLGRLRHEDWQPWKPPAYGVVMDGPRFYFPQLDGKSWGIRDIRFGTFQETALNDRGMMHDSIDLDRKRVYHHHETGGWPMTPARP